MNFITYPVNTKNPGSIIPTLLGIQWGQGLLNNTFVVYSDKLSRERNQFFDLSSWLVDKELLYPGLLQEENHKMPLSFFDLPQLQAEINIQEGQWYRCSCGKVEFLDRAILNTSYRKHLKLIDQQNRCILCGEEVTLCHGRGLIATLPHLSNLFIDEVLRKKVYPTNVYEEIQYWVKFFAGRTILLSRNRETPYEILYQQEKFYLDPTFYNIFTTFINGNNNTATVITGRDSVIAYALGLLIFRDKSPSHIFLPRFEINNWKEIISLSPDEITLLFIGALNWRTNKVKPNLLDLKFIRKNNAKLKEILRDRPLLNIEDISQFNRNLYTL